MTNRTHFSPLVAGDSVYLVTPMRGRTMEEVRAQARPVENTLRDYGIIVFSPSEEAEKTGQVWGVPEDDYEGFAWDVARILEVKALVLLDGWPSSSGGMFEITLANNLGKLVLEYNTWAPPVEKPGMTINYRDMPAPIAAALLKIVSTFARKNADYAVDGEWRSNFDSIARQMSIDPVQAADTLVAVKQDRLRTLRLNQRGPANEAIEDTYLDRMVYCVIAYALLLDDAE